MQFRVTCCDAEWEISRTRTGAVILFATFTFQVPTCLASTGSGIGAPMVTVVPPSARAACRFITVPMAARIKTAPPAMSLFRKFAWDSPLRYETATQLLEPLGPPQNCVSLNRVEGL